MIVDTKEKYKAFMASLAKTVGPIALDVETEAFSAERWLPWELQLEGVGLYTPEVSGFILPHLLDDLFQATIQGRSILMHNAKFDLAVLEQRWFNLRKQPFEDTMLMAYLLDENREIGLKKLAQTVLGVSEAEITKFTDVASKPERLVNALIPDQWYDEAYQKWVLEMGTYCLNDCKYTYQLYVKFKPELEAAGLQEVYERYEKPFMNVLRRIERYGIRVDLPYLNAMGKSLLAKLAILEVELDKLVQPKLNFNSALQLRKLFFVNKGYKLPATLLTKKGEASTNVEALEYIIKKYDDPVAKLLLEFRACSKLYSTYVLGLQRFQRQEIVHTSFKQTGTVTGRLSSSDPNLQNIPRSGESEFDVRRAFIPRPGCAFVIADYSQIELRLMAHFSKAKKMIETYQVNGDIHKTTADAVGCTRMVAKTINFGLNYGRTAYGMAKGLGISEEEAEKFIDGYFKQFPEVKVFMKESVDQVRKSAEVTTLIGRKRRFPEYVKARQAHQDSYAWRMERQAGNAIIQGSAADVIKVAMIQLDQDLEALGARVLLQIHDELIVECKIDDTEKVKAMVKASMESAIPLNGIPLYTEPSIATYWAK